MREGESIAYYKKLTFSKAGVIKYEADNLDRRIN